MKLYHISYDKVLNFVLRVPKNRLPEEDSTTPRICLSTSIEKCVNAKPNQAQALYLAKKQSFRMAMYVYEFHTDEIAEDKLIGPKQLKEKYHVLDAINNNEYWLLDCNVPYQEMRYEVIDGVFLSPDKDRPYPQALKLKLVQNVSQEAIQLEQAVCRYNKKIVNDNIHQITCDIAMINLPEKIRQIIRSHKATSDCGLILQKEMELLYRMRQRDIRESIYIFLKNTQRELPV